MKRRRYDSDDFLFWEWDTCQENVYSEPWCLNYEINIWDIIIDDNMQWSV